MVRHTGTTAWDSPSNTEKLGSLNPTTVATIGAVCVCVGGEGAVKGWLLSELHSALTVIINDGNRGRLTEEHNS